MSWMDYVSIDDTTFKILYKGVDIGLSREYQQDLYANTAMEITDEDIERIYNNCLEDIRDKKIDEILS